MRDGGRREWRRNNRIDRTQGEKESEKKMDGAWRKEGVRKERYTETDRHTDKEGGIEEVNNAE